MAVTGAPNEWVDFIDSMVPDILKLVIAGWNEIPRPSPDEQEDHITNALCTKIRQHRTARNLPFQIHTQFVELEPANNEKLGRLDIVFIPLTNREDIYFCLECKRLNVVKEGKPRSYASEYVSFGMMRFITGQYSKAVRHGGMTGYVLNSNLATAIKNVEANIKSRCSDLKMKPPGGFAASSVLNNEGHARETHHHRSKKSCSRFTICSLAPSHYVRNSRPLVGNSTGRQSEKGSHCAFTRRDCRGRLIKSENGREVQKQTSRR